MMKDFVRGWMGEQAETQAFLDLTAAEESGIKGIKEAYNRVKRERRGDVWYMVDFMYAIHWKSFEHHHTGNEEYEKFYDVLWHKAYDWARKTLKGDDLDYFYELVDN